MPSASRNGLCVPEGPCFALMSSIAWPRCGNCAHTSRNHASWTRALTGRPTRCSKRKLRDRRRHSSYVLDLGMVYAARAAGVAHWQQRKQSNARNSSSVDRRRLGKEAVEDMQAQFVILALEARMGNPRHHGKMLVGVGQQPEEVQQVVEARDAVP